MSENNRINKLEKEIAVLKTAEKILIDKKEDLYSLLVNAPAIILMTDRKGIILYINQTVPGFTVEDTIGTSIYDYIQSGYHEIMTKNIKEAFDEGKTSVMQITGSGPDGTTSWYSTHIAPVVRSGKTTAAMQVSSDI